MKEELEKGMLQRITISKDDLHWVEQGKEILVNGKMFDVEDLVHEGNYVTVTGLYDEDETSLISILNRLQSENSRGNNHLLAAFFKCMQSVFCDSFNPHTLRQSGDIHLFDMRTPALRDQFSRIPVPPPQA